MEERSPRILDIQTTRSLSRISHSLWGDFRKSLPISEDVLASVGLMQLDGEETLLRASKVLIERAERSAPGALALQHPFFRLAPIERFLLTVLHVESWSYSRIARVLGIERKLIAPWAWAARMKFCFQEMPGSTEYPRGPTSLGPRCPEYDITAPWTQTFLDEELGTKERMFLQNHLMACDACRRSLDLSRKMIFKIESMIPVKYASEDTEIAAERLLATWRSGESAYEPIKTTFQDSLRKLFSSPGAQTAAVVILAASFILLKRLF
ncbi:MAG: zf-HC2 domain-containing protein [Proteobacteria bacterium]|nr:zf-HC2 domain-containing protein [Pseudomonadota bacterium]